jgi:hypothetical protein
VVTAPIIYTTPFSIIVSTETKVLKKLERIEDQISYKCFHSPECSKIKLFQVPLCSELDHVRMQIEDNELPADLVTWNEPETGVLSEPSCNKVTVCGNVLPPQHVLI